MSILVFVELDQGRPTTASLAVLAKALTLGDTEIAAVLIGNDVAAALEDVAACSAATVFAVEDERLDSLLPQPHVDVIEEIVRDGGYDTVMFSTSILAADVAGGLAARMEAGLNWDLVDIEIRDGEPVGKRPALQDSVIVTVGWRSTPRLALMRAGSFDGVIRVSETETTSATHEAVTADCLRQHSANSWIVERTLIEQVGPSIEDADVVVAGGRGLAGRDGFELVEQLADVLGGVVGATRPVVDAGWFPFSAQIGQTGKTVTPTLYLALGISGAVQHKVGMQNARVIIAINNDPEAPIFEFCDFGVVGDARDVVPELTRLLGQGAAETR